MVLKGYLDVKESGSGVAVRYTWKGREINVEGFMEIRKESDLET